MRRIRFGLQSLALAVICLLSSPALLAQAPSSIQVFMPNGGLPVTVIRINLVRDDGYTDIVYTDSKGKYSMRTQPGSYHVTIDGDKQTYDTTTANFTVDRNNPNQINIFLRSIASPKPAPSGVLDVADFEDNIPSRARTAYKRAMEAVANNEVEAAISGLQQAISLYPQYVRALNDLGVIFLKSDRLEEAAASFRKAIEFNKRFFHPRMNLGVVLNKQGKYREALDVLEPLYNENHGMLELRLAYARALEGAGELPEAEKVYRATLESKNLSTTTRAQMDFSLGVILNRQGRFSEAVTALEKAIVLTPESANCHLQLGAALVQLKQLSRAEQELLRAYELGGKAAGGAQLLLGEIYYNQRKIKDAQRAFEQYLKDVPAAPNASQIAQLIADLKVIKN